MKQEFVTVYGKVEIARGNIYIKDIKKPLEDTLVVKLALPLVFLIASVARVVYAEGPKDYFGGVMYAIFAISLSGPVWEWLTRRTYATKISLDEVESITFRKKNFGMETDMQLHLKNKRFRSISFRTLENQHEAFAALIPGAVHQTTIA